VRIFWREFINGPASCNVTQRRRRLVVVSEDYPQALSPAPSFSPSSAPDTSDARFLLLPTAQILLTTQGSEIYIYTPDAASNNPADAWRPAGISVPPEMYIGYHYTVSGIQLNGLSQAVSFGDEAQMATNYPIVQLSNAAGQVKYARSYDFSTMGVATGTTVQSCTIQIPSDLEPGEWNLVVIANGIPSEPPVRVNLSIYPCQRLIDNPPTAETTTATPHLRQRSPLGKAS
jgi:hypothetical protein